MMEPICNMVTDNVYLYILCQIIVHIKSTVKFISTSSTDIFEYIMWIHSNFQKLISYPWQGLRRRGGCRCTHNIV